MSLYTAEQVKTEVFADIDRLFAPWTIGRPSNWTCDVATKHIVSIGYWLEEKLAMICNDADRKTQVWKFNRMSRTYDMWEIAAECINEALENNIEQNRKPHRRWG